MNNNLYKRTFQQFYSHTINSPQLQISKHVRNRPSRFLLSINRCYVNQKQKKGFNINAGNVQANVSSLASSNVQNNQRKVKVVNPIGSIENWYKNANKFWSSSQSTYDGVLNGFGNLSAIDIAHSTHFLNSYIATKVNSKFKADRVLDCGAGIGRIAKQMLCNVFKTVDLIDQCQKYIQKSKQILKDKKIGHFYAKGLQQFKFQEKYDTIWVQWVLSHLTDQDAISFLKQAKKSLNQDGFIVVKENHSEKGFIVDKDDCSIARSTQLYKKIFEQASLKVMKEEVQKDWPKDLLDVKMYILE